MPTKTIQEILGHSSIKTTLDTYSHVTKEMHKVAANEISSVISKAIQ